MHSHRVHKHSIDTVSGIEPWKFNRIHDLLRCDIESLRVFKRVMILQQQFDRVISEPADFLSQVIVRSQHYIDCLTAILNSDDSLKSIGSAVHKVFVSDCDLAELLWALSDDD